MDELIAFLKARLDEDEKLAKAAAEAQTARGRGAEWDPGIPMDMISEHIARHDPARVLREVAAKREFLRRSYPHRNEMDVHPNGLVSPRALLIRQTLTDMTAVYSDHPDYGHAVTPDVPDFTARSG